MSEDGIDGLRLLQSEERMVFHRYPLALPLLILVIGTLITLLAIVGIERAQNTAERSRLVSNGQEIVAALRRKMDENIAYLGASATVFSYDNQVSQEAFAKFAKQLNADYIKRGSLGTGWARALKPGALGGMAVHPAPQRDAELVAPVTFLEPMTPDNAKAIGFDMFSEPVRREAINQAYQMRRPAASGKVLLQQDMGTSNRGGFLIYAPVFSGPKRDGRLVGFVYSPIRGQQFLESAIALTERPDIEIAVYDSTNEPANLLAKRALPGANGMVFEQSVMMGEHHWIVTVQSKRTPLISGLSWLVLAFGTVLTGLLVLVAHLVMQRAAADRMALEELANHTAIRTALTRELNHRVKNTLANVMSIIALTKRRSASLDDFAETLTGRVRALSATHDLLSQSEWRSALIADIVRSELAPYMDESDCHVSMQGDPIGLAPNNALSLGLALHELATNAAKYGALSAADGHVSIDWKLIAPDVAELNWRESGGPQVREPDRRGFGLDLIEKIVAHELQSPVELTFAPEGVQCRLRVPVRNLEDFEIRAGREAGS